MCGFCSLAFLNAFFIWPLLLISFFSFFLFNFYYYGVLFIGIKILFFYIFRCIFVLFSIICVIFIVFRGLLLLLLLLLLVEFFKNKKTHKNQVNNVDVTFGRCVCYVWLCMWCTLVLGSYWMQMILFRMALLFYCYLFYVVVIWFCICFSVLDIYEKWQRTRKKEWERCAVCM